MVLNHSNNIYMQWSCRKCYREYAKNHQKSCLQKCWPHSDSSWAIVLLLTSRKASNNAVCTRTPRTSHNLLCCKRLMGIYTATTADGWRWSLTDPIQCKPPPVENIIYRFFGVHSSYYLVYKTIIVVIYWLGAKDSAKWRLADLSWKICNLIMLPTLFSFCSKKKSNLLMPLKGTSVFGERDASFVNGSSGSQTR